MCGGRLACSRDKNTQGFECNLYGLVTYYFFWKSYFYCPGNRTAFSYHKGFPIYFRIVAVVDWAW